MGRTWTDVFGKRLISVLSNWLYPPTCILCGDPAPVHRDLCPGCQGDLTPNEPCCPVCALPAPVGAGDLPCGRCLKKNPLFDRCLAPFRYLPPADELIGGLKFRGRLSHARVMGELMADHLVGRVAGDDYPQVLIPVPLHPRRLRERSFNQAMELARPVARRLGIPLHAQGCRRRIATPQQTGLSALERRRNLRGAFTVSQLAGIEHAAIIDDVVTTGATVTEMTRVLRRAGVARIEVWAVCRTPEPVGL